MQNTFSLDGVQAILTFPFKDPKWQNKLVIGAVLVFANYFIPILPSIALLGYSARIMHNIIADEAITGLPEWDDWGDLFSRGLKLFGASFIYLLPALLLIIGGYGLLFLSPLFTIPFMAGSDTHISTGLLAAQLIGTFAGIFVLVIGFLLAAPLSLVLPPALAHVVAKGSFTAAFHIREWRPIARANLAGFVAAIVVIGGVYLVLIFAIQVLYFTILLCFLTPFLVSAVMTYLSIVSAVTVAEAYRKGVANLAKSAAPAA